MAAGRSWPRKAHETIRQTLQAHNAESPQYRGTRDLFQMVEPGQWRLKDRRPHAATRHMGHRDREASRRHQPKTSKEDTLLNQNVTQGVQALSLGTALDLQDFDFKFESVVPRGGI